MQQGGALHRGLVSIRASPSGLGGAGLPAVTWAEAQPRSSFRPGAMVGPVAASFLSRLGLGGHKRPPRVRPSRPLVLASRVQERRQEQTGERPACRVPWGGLLARSLGLSLSVSVSPQSGRA